MQAKPSDSFFHNLRVFLVDDDDAIAGAIATDLRDLGAQVHRAATFREALETFAAFQPDLVITDLHLPDGNGLELMRRWRSECPQLPIILITAHGAIDSAITALRLGAFDYLQKPFAMQNLIMAVRRAAEVGSLRRRVSQFEGEVKGREPFTIVGESPRMAVLRRILQRVARSKADTVLIHGESGTGKELAARAIHEWSDRANDPFVEINCASIPETLLESELFGYEKGAFTDARERKLGLFEVAGSGTVFLDEIGEMPLKLQAKLLRVVEYRRFKRLGGTKDIEFKGRIVAATNRHLEEEIVAGHFRADLYYRLNIVPIVVPPLRERREDLPALTEFLLARVCRALDVPQPAISPEAMAELHAHEWRGNVRELKNVLQRSLIFHQPAVLTPDTLELRASEAFVKPRATLEAVGDNVRPFPGAHLAESPTTPEAMDAASPGGAPAAAMAAMPARTDEPFTLPANGVKLEELEKSLLMQALAQARYNQTKAAQLLGITRHALRYRLEKFGLLHPG